MTQNEKNKAVAVIGAGNSSTATLPILQRRRPTACGRASSPGSGCPVRRRRKFLRHAEDRAHLPSPLHERKSNRTSSSISSILQLPTLSLDTRLPIPRRTRGDDEVGLREPRKIAFLAIFLHAKRKAWLYLYQGLCFIFNRLHGRKWRGIPAPHGRPWKRGNIGDHQ